MSSPATIIPATLTTSEAHEYVRKVSMFEWLVERYQLKPLWKGPGQRSNRTTLWSKEQIDHALRQLELSGGFDVETNAPIKS